jgi:transcriptional regulator with XRE-family HTH domain
MPNARASADTFPSKYASASALVMPHYGATHMGQHINSFNGPATVDYMESRGTRIQRRRKELGMNQTTLALAVGVDQSTVSDWEKRDAEPRAEQLMKLATALQTTAEYLVLGSSVSTDLSPEVAALAAAIETLPRKQRDWVLMMLREAVKLARETVTESSVNQNGSPREEVTRSASSKRRKAA